MPLPNPTSAELAHTLSEVVREGGPDVLTRGDGLLAWREARLRAGVWTWSRTIEGPAGPRVTLRNAAGIAVHGLNFASHDPLALGAHPALRDAVVEAVRQHGCFTTGSPCGPGGSPAGAALATALAELLELEHVLLFSSGWAAAFGALTALLEPDDHVILDTCAHPSLHEGARAASRHVHCHAHRNVEAVRRALATIRAVDARHAVLVVTESFFPLESDAPDLRALQAVCREGGARLLVAVGYDLGTSGPRGTGQLGVQRLLGTVDCVVGSFAKSLATNGGFFATGAAAARHLVEVRASAWWASNALPPPNASSALEALRIVGSTVGDQLRGDLGRAVDGFCEAAMRFGLTCLGSRSAVVPVSVGDEGEARLAEALAAEHGVLVGVAEEPTVPRTTARLVVHVSAAHRPDHVAEAALTLGQALGAARSVSRKARENE